jgi:hypothetical protein
MNWEALYLDAQATAHKRAYLIGQIEGMLKSALHETNPETTRRMIEATLRHIEEGF